MMPHDLNWLDFLTEADDPTGAPGGVAPQQQGTPPGPPLQGASDPANNSGPPKGNPPQQDQGPGPDQTDDPQAPEVPADQPGQQGFETWKRNFMKLAIKGDPAEMMLSLNSMRDQPSQNFELPQKRFLDDNHMILAFRQNPLIAKASTEIRKNLKQQLDRNQPAVSVMTYLYGTLSNMYQEQPLIRDVFLKFVGFHAPKAELHRKFIAALLGAVQEGGGGTAHDLRYSEKEYSIPISTRFYSEFGNVNLCDWALQKRDPEKYLPDSDQEKLNTDGTPEEKQVIRRRVVVSSICDRLKNRSFLMHITTLDGNVYHFGWDVSEGLMGGFREGKLVVRSKGPNDADAMYNDQGDLVSLVDVVMYYLKPTGETDENGRPKTREVPFLERRDGQLYLTASLETMRDLANGLTGFFFKEDPFTGNPSDIRNVMRAIPSLEEMLLRPSS